MQNIVIGTNNKGKLKEYKFFLSDFFNVLTPTDIGIDFNVAETGTTYEENSLLKLEFLRNKNLNMAILCDDSGLEIESLNNEPGVYSARYAGEDSNDRETNNKNYHLVSMALIHIVNKYDVGSKYNAYSCPMVKKKWVQNSSKMAKVHNPYAPNMPHCGSQDSHH